MNATALALPLLLAAGPSELSPLLDAMRIEQDVPGVSAVVTRRDEVLFAGGSGLADLESGRRMTAETVLYAGSLTKVMTALLVLSLVDDGRLSLDDRVELVGGGDPGVTIAHLLTHSSGLVREGNFGYWFDADFPDASALSGFLATAVLRSQPGETIHYSNIGYAALGLVIQSVTGEPYHSALRKRVLAPLGMDRTGSPGPAAGVATGYTPPARILPSAGRPFAGVGRKVGNRNVREYHDAAAMTPAFGGYTTASDLGRLLIFLVGDDEADIVSPALRAAMLEPQDRGRTFGLGIGRRDGRKIARHGGWFAAHRSAILIDPEAGIGIAVLANGDNADPDSIAGALLALTLNGAQ